MKIGYQLKQVRERLAKGLVDKGILRTEKRNFLLFDMATHPIAPDGGGAKEELRRRVRATLTQRTVILPPSPFLPEGIPFRYLRTVAMLCAAYAANVLENALGTLGHEARERAFAQVDELLGEYAQWPFGKGAGRGEGGVGANLEAVIREEVNAAGEGKELQLEVCQFFLFVRFVFVVVQCFLWCPCRGAGGHYMECWQRGRALTFFCFILIVYLDLWGSLVIGRAFTLTWARADNRLSQRA